MDRTSPTRANKSPEYNDIFRRMFDVLSESIDRNRPVRELVRKKKTEEITCDPSYSESPSESA